MLSSLSLILIHFFIDVSKHKQIINRLQKEYKIQCTGQQIMMEHWLHKVLFGHFSALLWKQLWNLVNGLSFSFLKFADGGYMFEIVVIRCANVFLHPVTEDIAPGYHNVVFR